MNTLDTLANPPHDSKARQRETARAMTSPSQEALLERVCERIAPTWPLDRFIAVNPFWGMVDRPLAEVATKLSATSGAQLLMPRAWYRQAHREGRLRDEHLLAALDWSASKLSLAGLHALLEQDEPVVPTRARVADLVDDAQELPDEGSWRTFVTHSVSQFCAAHFDEGQAALHPACEGGLYAAWRSMAPEDRTPTYRMNLKSYQALANDLPATAGELIARALHGLGIGEAEAEMYLWGLLLEQNGWASWCAYRRWTARQQQREDRSLIDLLAIRLAWEWMLLRAGGPSLMQRWKAACKRWPRIDAAARESRAHDWLLQIAMEIAWQEPVVRALPAGLRTPRPANPAVQAAFCIDVRSEVFRRALEATAPAVQTLGFAGFFGMPIAYQPLGSATTRPQLPGLIAPRFLAADRCSEGAIGAQRAWYLDVAATWKRFSTDALSSFAFVEAFGLSFAGKLLQDSFSLGKAPDIDRVGLSAPGDACRKPSLVATADGHPIEGTTRADLAENMLRAMSLTRGFARLVVLIGHGSTSRNNPHAAGLDCGACGGQTGEANARIAAALLNDPDVRLALANREIAIPGDTYFLAGLHNTTVDEVTLFDCEDVPSTHSADLDTFRTWLHAASTRARAERAEALGLADVHASQLQDAVHSRAHDWAQLRPEWGLANNAALIVAPREHCRHLNLQGRAFLHEYRPEEDPEHRILEQIMTAPMVVAHWINMQYYASTVDPQRYGSGNKLLHNVVGGHIGVFEGNGGDLRIGLPRQSVHDGRRWMHTPLRLSVFVEAPRAAIERVLAKHARVRDLVNHEWLALFQLDAVTGAVYAYRDGFWVQRSEEAPEVQHR